MYQWWVFLHLAGVFAFLVSHGVSMVITFRLQRERDPRNVAALLQLSSATISAFYISLVLLVLGGILAAFQGHLWSYGWIWGSAIVLLLVFLAMYFMARPYYQRVRFVTAALVEGSQAVTADQYDSILRSGRARTIASIGLGGLAVILYLMLFKPTLGVTPAQSASSSSGSSTSATAEARGTTVSLTANELSFSSDRILVPSDKGLTLVFDNQAAGVSHNVSIHTPDGNAEFTGKVIAGPQKVNYQVPALKSGTYSFQCDVHPQQMTGTLVAK